MTGCARCGVEAERTYECEHTGNKGMCKECYQETHWLLTTNNEPKNAS